MTLPRSTSSPIVRRAVAVLLGGALLATSCGGSSTPAAEPVSGDQSSTVDVAASVPGVRLVSAVDGAALADDPPADLVILDVRTPEEYAEGHIDGAVMIDFYRDDFAEQLAGLDPSVPYLLYCRSGNRSGQTALAMRDLGFTDVADVDGGIISWGGAGLPIVVE